MSEVWAYLDADTQVEEYELAQWHSGVSPKKRTKGEETKPGLDGRTLQASTNYCTTTTTTTTTSH